MAFENSQSGKAPYATIGQSVQVKGEIAGEEDILIEGSVEGSINLKKNTVTIAKTGRVKANILGVIIHVEGEVTGDLQGVEKVIVHASGRVVGNITAPRISLEDGARVKGMIDSEGNGDSDRLHNRIEEIRVSAAAKSNNGAPKAAAAAPIVTLS